MLEGESGQGGTSLYLLSDYQSAEGSVSVRGWGGEGVVHYLECLE